MDAFSPRLYEAGVKATIGKGYRSREVRESLVTYRAVHFAATGGAGALLSECIVQSRVIAYSHLGTEAVREMKVVDFPVVVAYDCSGRSIYGD
jgi:fumarate hydratase subunit beta